MPLIVLEGIDGCGKTTQITRLSERLRTAGVIFTALREPGGTDLGERLRTLLLDPGTKACPTAELFAYLVARAQLCHEVIIPALDRNELVILDRFYHSTLAYQAYGLGLDLVQVRASIRLATAGIVPDVVLWLNLDPAEAQRRRAAARGTDRIEARGLDYLKRVHDGYLALVDSDELIALDATLPATDLADEIWKWVEPVARVAPQKPS